MALVKGHNGVSFNVEAFNQLTVIRMWNQFQTIEQKQLQKSVLYLSFKLKPEDSKNIPTNSPKKKRGGDSLTCKHNILCGVHLWGVKGGRGRLCLPLKGGEGYVFHRWEGWATSLANFVCFFIQILWKLQFGKSTRLQPGVGATVLYLSWGSGLCLCRSPVCRSLCRAASHNP